jgi:hypothetical protein
MVLANTYILTGVMNGTPLANDYVAGFSSLTAEKLETKSFTFRFATVT